MRLSSVGFEVNNRPLAHAGCFGQRSLRLALLSHKSLSFSPRNGRDDEMQTFSKGVFAAIFKLALAFLFVPMFKKTPQVYSGLARRRVKEQHSEKVRT